MTQSTDPSAETEEPAPESVSALQPPDEPAGEVAPQSLPLAEPSPDMAADDEPAPTACRFCQTAVHALHTYCTACGYPEQGTHAQRKRFVKRLRRLKKDYLNGRNRIRQAGRWMLIIGGINLLGAFVRFTGTVEERVIALVMVAVGLPLVVLGFRTFRRQSVVAIWIAGLLYTVVVMGTVVNGMLPRVLIAVGYVVTLIATYETRRFIRARRKLMLNDNIRDKLDIQ